MRFVIFDPGFEDMSSHHANVNRQLSVSADKNNHSLTILVANKYCPTHQVQNEGNAFQQQLVPYFNTPCYTNNLKPLSVTQEQTLSQQFCAELHQAYQNNLIQSADTLLIHTCFSFHILGLAAWLNDMKKHFTGKLLLCGMFYPGEPTLKAGDELINYQWYIRNRLAFLSLNQACEKISLTLATSNQTYLKAYQACTDMPFTLHPAVNYIAPQVTSSKSTTKKRVILYIGSVKQDKGLNYLAQVLPELLEQLNDIEFFLHFNEASPGARDFLSLKQHIVDLAKVHPNLILYFDPMTQNDYEYQLSISDAVVLSYEPHSYQNKTSGLLWDVVRYPSLAFICAKGIWAEEEYKAIGGCPFTFDYADKQSLIHTLSHWKSKNLSNLTLSEYGKTINQSFADWCFSASANM
jgi:glycosyltransferase involved in cell wall biosynthesis